MSDILFNDNWQFALKQIGTPLSEMESELSWHDVEIPHDWLIGDTAHLYETGEGWYKKKFDITGYSENKSYIIRFDGVYMNSTVYVNGAEVGTWKYGYSTFSFDISEHLREGGNVIYVRVCHESPNTRWYSGAGIYRNVHLRVTSKVHVKENGVYISTRQKENKWLVNIETETTHDGCTVSHTVYNEKNNAVAKVEGSVENCFSRLKFIAENPNLWSIDTPYCYKVRTELLLDGVVLDCVENIFGFRTTEFIPDKGFFLNGEKMKFHGVCMHHDLGALGSAMNIHALRRQLEILKSFGVNAIRTSHNMPARELVELCNTMGFLMDSEGFDMWEQPKTSNDYARFFPEWYERDVKAWIERDRNAPCVIMWSIGNEIADTNMSERGLEVAKMLAAAVRRYDKYGNARCTIGSNYMRWENAQKVADYLKLAGYNYAEDLYAEHHEKHPDWFIYGSETASTVRSRGVYRSPASSPLLTNEDMQCSDYGNSVVSWGKAQEKAWIDDRDCDFCGGQFIWTGFDYIGEPTPYSTKNSYFGIVDTAGFPKNSYYLYKAVWTDAKKEPFVHILPYWDFNVGEEIDVFTYSNLERVELFFNESSLGVQEIDLKHGKVLHGEWKLPYRRGTIVARAYDENGNVAAESSVTSFGEAASICAEPSKSVFNADGRDLVFIEISVKDDMGITVENARNRINVSVSGPARLVGLDSGDSTDYDSYKGSSKLLFSGKLLAIIQSTFEAGTVTVTLNSAGLPEKVIILEAAECERPEGVSVVGEYFPKEAEPYKPEIPLRKIELRADRKALDPGDPTAHITARLFPENAEYTDLEWKCYIDSGVPVSYSKIEAEGNSATVTAVGDGSYRVRASCKNGGKYPQVFSELTFTNSDFGISNMDAFGFISASLFTYSSEQLNMIASGAVSGFNKRTEVSFEPVDFGAFGSDTLLLSCGHAGGNAPISVELWLGDPGNGGELIDIVDFCRNGCWDSFAPQEFRLSKRISGINKVTFVFSEHIIFGGFEFVKQEKAYQQLDAASCDSLYGDEFEVNGRCVENIGNNVVLNFSAMDFTHGAEKITVCGRTPNETNSVQISFTDENGVRSTQMIAFPHSDEYTEITFPLERIAEGKYDVGFVFLPGCRFDFMWFRFE